MKLHRTAPLLLSFTFYLLRCGESTQPPFSCDSSSSSNAFPFCNTALTIPERVKDLVSRLTLYEKISQLVNTAPTIPRLNISAYQWWSEALHGVSRHGKGVSFNGTIRSATMFPQVILAAASFDSRLWFRIAQAIGTEARAMFNQGQVMGMTFWAPNINIFRDPRWGRGQETPGEDPLVAGTYAVSYVRGIQGDNFEGGQLKDGHLQASACCKHFTAHDLDDWNGFNRYTFDALVTEQDMADTYQPPFRSCVQKGQASGIMCAYNRINGVPNCADYNLLSETARGEWGFQGYIASDCDAVAIIHDSQSYVKLPEDAVADVLKAGMDLNCGSYLAKYTNSAIQQKKLQESDIDRALYNLFSIRMRLGLFNDPKTQELGKIGPGMVCSKEHLDLATDAARNGIVLLKNSQRLLPLSKTATRSLAVIGPNANSTGVLLGNYEGVPCNNITILQALEGYVKNVAHHSGCDSVNCTEVAYKEATDIAKQSDNVVLVMGLDQTQEREKHDRLELVLPGKQQSLITEVAGAANKPVILVVLSGGPVDISFAKENPKIGGMFWAGYPGERGGIAMAEIIFGDFNPGGKLPVTWYPQEFIKVPMTDMHMRPNTSTGYPGRTYRFYTGEKVFEFGYGLSYSNYSYESISVDQNKLYLNALLPSHEKGEKSVPLSYLLLTQVGPEFCKNTTLRATVAVKNNGEMAGKHTVLLFIRQAKLKNGAPRKTLIGFNIFNLKAGERAEVRFLINPCEHLAIANKDGLMVIESGLKFLIVGDKKCRLNIVP